MALLRTVESALSSGDGSVSVAGATGPDRVIAGKMLLVGGSEAVADG